MEPAQLSEIAVDREVFPGLSMGMGFLWESHGKRPMGSDRHKLLWGGNGTDKYVPWTTLGLSMGMSFIPMGIPWETSHGMGWDGKGINCYGNGTDMCHGQPWVFQAPL